MKGQVQEYSAAVLTSPLSFELFAVFWAAGNKIKCVSNALIKQKDKLGGLESSVQQVSKKLMEFGLNIFWLSAESVQPQDLAHNESLN